MRKRKQNRLNGFDYSSNRYYFVTIRTKNHTHSFGKIENKLMKLSPEGIIASEQWIWLQNQYPYLDLISFIIMPDHVHGIIKINSDYYNNIVNRNDNDENGNDNDNVGNGNDNVGNGNDNVGNGNDNVGNGRDHSLHNTNFHSQHDTNFLSLHKTIDQNFLKIKPLPEIVGAYKTTVSKRIHLAGNMAFR